MKTLLSFNTINTKKI